MKYFKLKILFTFTKEVGGATHKQVEKIKNVLLMFSLHVRNIFWLISASTLVQKNVVAKINKLLFKMNVPIIFEC